MGYHSSFRTFIRATPYSLVYGMDVVLLVEIELGSLRVALEQQIYETEWAQVRFDQLNLLDEKRLRAVDHVQAYQRKTTRAFKKWVIRLTVLVAPSPATAPFDSTHDSLALKAYQQNLYLEYYY